VEKSLQLRKRKALARSQIRRRLAEGKVRLDQVSLAAAAHPDSFKSPLVIRRSRDDYEDVEF
jgi:hypothetical protein